jgi:DNA-binding transcriptional regulator/RsmH inhibitor MraZ
MIGGSLRPTIRRTSSSGGPATADRRRDKVADMGKQRVSDTGFLGVDEATVSGDCRIRLPRSAVRQLRKQRVGRLWLGIVPQAKALVLCPEGTWDRWVEGLQKQYPNLDTPRGFRAFLSPSKRITVDGKGRISVQGAKRLREHAGIGIGQTVVVVGMGDYFELWDEGAFRDTMAQSERDLGGTRGGAGTSGGAAPGRTSGKTSPSPAQIGPVGGTLEPKIP